MTLLLAHRKGRERGQAPSKQPNQKTGVVSPCRLRLWLCRSVSVCQCPPCSAPDGSLRRLLLLRRLRLLQVGLSQRGAQVDLLLQVS